QRPSQTGFRFAGKASLEQNRRQQVVQSRVQLVGGECLLAPTLRLFEPTEIGIGLRQCLHGAAAVSSIRLRFSEKAGEIPRGRGVIAAVEERLHSRGKWSRRLRRGGGLTAPLFLLGRGTVTAAVPELAANSRKLQIRNR